MFGSFLRTVAVTLMGVLPASALDTSQGSLMVTRMADRLNEPWSFGFLPDGSVLITERGGALLRLTDTGRHQVAGVADVAVQGQGGLLDVMIPRDFDSSREVFLSYAKRQAGGAGTAVAVARLSRDGQQLENWTEIFQLSPGSSGGRHFAGRLVEAADGTIFLTIGDRGDRPSSQDLSRENGTVVRINRDGSIPSDNPFVGQDGARAVIWSYGHRNAQGAGLDLDGNLWLSEHGARGGDEVNAVRKGANYGWPVISYGRHYSGAKIGEGTRKDGMEQPEYYWDPSMAPSGLMVYSGALWPEWRGDIFVGSLKFDYIARLDGQPLTEDEQLMSPETERVRDIREAPDGSIWFLSVGNGTLYRMSPG